MKEHCLQWTDALDYGTLSSQDSQVLSNLAISLSTVGGSHKRWRYQTRAELHEASCSIHLLSTRVRLNVRALAGISDKAPWFNHRRTLLCCRIIEPINILNMSKHRNLAVLKQLRKWPLYLLWVNSLVCWIIMASTVCKPALFTRPTISLEMGYVNVCRWRTSQ